MCVGKMPSPEPHDDDFNTHRMCLDGADKDGGTFDLQINKTDAYLMGLLLIEVGKG